jgi:hypothetical protein
MSHPNLIQRLLASLRRRRLDSELEDEIQSHLELAERDEIARGVSPKDARAAARRSFGGVAQMQEEHRDVRTVVWVETALRDFRLGVASLRRDPTFTTVAIGVLALGIGANTAMFSLLDAVLLRPLPFLEPERMVKVWETPSPGSHNTANAADFLDGKRLNTVFEALSAESGITATLTGQGEPERLPGQARFGRSFPGLRSEGATRTHFRARRRSAGSRTGHPVEQWRLAYPLWHRSQHPESPSYLGWPIASNYWRLTQRRL